MNKSVKQKTDECGGCIFSHERSSKIGLNKQKRSKTIKNLHFTTLPPP